MSILTVYRGEISALVGALFTVFGHVIYRRCSDDLDIVTINLLRSFLGFLLVFLLAIIVQDFSEVIFSLSGLVVLLLLVSVLFSIVIGDTTYLKAQQYIGVSRTAPVNRSKALFTLFGAYFLLGEPLTNRIFVGVLLVLFGVFLVTQKTSTEQLEPFETSRRNFGFVLAIVSALAQTIGVLILRLVVDTLDPVSTQAIRYGFAFVYLGMISTRNSPIKSIKKSSRNTLLLVAIATVFNVLIGSVLWVTAVKYAGAAKATTLGSTGPLFAIPVSMIVLKESMSWKILLGTILTISGIWFVI